jgi:hypothetical protein
VGPVARGLRACALATAVLLPGGAQAQTGMLALIQKGAADPTCAQVQVLGPCFCGPVPCGLRIAQYVPVAFVEITKAPGDSLFAPAAAPAVAAQFLGTASIDRTGTDNTAEAHVWLIPDDALPAGLCPGCRPSNARLPAPPSDLAGPMCGASEAVAQALSGQAAAFSSATPAGAWLPHLAYATEADALNWHTGCRDLAAAALPDWPACPGGLAGAALAPLDPNCLGAWGPLKPRQMRDLGPTPVLYAAKTAVRAMSIARTQLGSFPYPVDILGNLQQVYPAVSSCFAVGQLPLPATALPSVDGRTGWIYWRPTTCCVKASNVAAQCLRSAVHP